jgi:glutamate synthase domain-containing protein 3
MIEIDAKGVYYKDLNEMVKEAIANGEDEIILLNINGQRYIGDGLRGNAKIIIKGTPGNDLAAFMDGLTIIVNSNAQDAVANTMNGGKIVIHGDARDVLGYGMRGGKLFIEGDVGYRVGIHMKEYEDQRPIIIAGGRAGDFLGEYMAGGTIIILGLEEDPIVGDFVGTGMHGGVIYIRGDVESYQISKDVETSSLTEDDQKTLMEYLDEYCKEFSLDLNEIMEKSFIKLMPRSCRPYGNLYAY